MPSADVIVALDQASLGVERALVGPLSLIIPMGARLAITGPNGSGKSLLLKAIAGQVAVFSGDFWRYPKLTLMLLAQESMRRDPWPLSGHDWFAAMGIVPPELPRLAALLPKRIDSLSGGQWQLLRLAAALTPPAGAGVKVPHLVMLDEPANHLDQAVKQIAVELMKELSQNVTLLMPGHDRGMIDACGAKSLPLEACLDAA
ncbi:ATP-binding cassette domain-containing protein [Halomonas sp. M1]|uniref:ATP-binding cassette domain-containing protein n=1 Tax=Halomonas sp. M1 TaxID=3035470 RepID=UPI002485B2B4|nr:ATP-binding cassette domain-containing protein [Halomonas sp. M1]WFE71123.1 ATP-binding cassette domain-containing protein [Halomonas sp. M1]